MFKVASLIVVFTIDETLPIVHSNGITFNTPIEDIYNYNLWKIICLFENQVLYLTVIPSIYGPDWKMDLGIFYKMDLYITLKWCSQH